MPREVIGQLPFSTIGITKGASDNLPVIVTSKEHGVKSAYDITDKILVFTVKKGTVVVINKVLSEFDNPTLGEAVIELTPADTNLALGSYDFGLWLIEDEGTRYPISRGRILVAEVPFKKDEEA